MDLTRPQIKGRLGSDDDITEQDDKEHNPGFAYCLEALL